MILIWFLHLYLYRIWERVQSIRNFFRIHLDDLCDAFATNLDWLTNGLFARGIIGQAIQQSTTIEAISDYRKTSKLVHELYKQLQSHNDPKQYLTKICDVLLKQHDQRLIDIVSNIKAKL